MRWYGISGVSSAEKWLWCFKKIEAYPFLSIGGQYLGDFVQMAYVDSEQMTLRSCGILSCALTNTHVCARPSDPLQFRNGSKGAVKNGASEPRQQTLAGGVHNTHWTSQCCAFGRQSWGRHRGEFVMMWWLVVAKPVVILSTPRSTLAVGTAGCTVVSLHV